MRPTVHRAVLPAVTPDRATDFFARGAGEAGGEGGAGAELASDEVGVGDDLPEGDIDGEDEVIAEAEIGLTGGDIDAAGGESDIEELLFGGRGGEPDGEFA